MKKYNIFAFTLAEVLITLSVLGIIAAITVPSVIHKFQDRILLTQFKVAYSTLDQAIRMAIIENGTLDTWSWPSLNGGGSDALYFAEKINNYLQVEKYCGADSGNCLFYGYNLAAACTKYNGNYLYHSAAYQTLSGSCHVNSNRVNWIGGRTQLKNGMIWGVQGLQYPKGYPYRYGAAYGQVVRILIDINGTKSPNRVGYDVFLFDVHKRLGLTPYMRNNNTADNCSTSKANFSEASCTSWVTVHNNFDYKYRDVSSQWSTVTGQNSRVDD